MQNRLMSEDFLQVRVLGWDESSDMFTLGEGVSSPNPQPVPNFTVPGALLPTFIGEYGEPSELIGRDFDVYFPA